VLFLLSIDLGLEINFLVKKRTVNIEIIPIITKGAFLLNTNIAEPTKGPAIWPMPPKEDCIPNAHPDELEFFSDT
jgi:hypothetical protein